MTSLMNAISWSWTEFFNNMLNSTTDQNTIELLNKVFNIISIVLWVALGVVGAIGAVYAIWLGIKLARADEDSKRDEAKKHLLYVLIAIGATAALILVLNVFLPAILSAFDVGNVKGGNITGGTNDNLNRG